MTRTRDNHFYTMRFSYSPIKHFNMYLYFMLPQVFQGCTDYIPNLGRFYTD